MYCNYEQQTRRVEQNSAADTYRYATGIILITHRRLSGAYFIIEFEIHLVLRTYTKLVIRLPSIVWSPGPLNNKYPTHDEVVLAALHGRRPISIICQLAKTSKLPHCDVDPLANNTISELIAFPSFSTLRVSLGSRLDSGGSRCHWPTRAVRLQALCSCTPRALLRYHVFTIMMAILRSTISDFPMDSQV